VYDPQGAARAGLINLATTWRDSGATYQAISVYTEVLTRYPGSSAAAAATEGLVEMARNLQEQGRFYTALSILRKLEDLA
jgi:TolA-binding protein